VRIPLDDRGEVVAIVLSWNDAERVLALLGQLAKLEPAPDHVVIIDNGSAATEVERIADAFPRHEIIRLATNCGFAAAVNRGIDCALVRGAAWVWLLNTDIVLPAAALASLRATGEADARCAMAGAVLVDADGRVQARGGRVNLWTGDLRHVHLPGGHFDYLSAACLLVRSSMLREIGAFDEGYFFYWEDVELAFRARAAGWKLSVAEDCHVVHEEAASLGRWSAGRWYLLFRGMSRFLGAFAPFPRTASLVRLCVHTVTMLRHGRCAPVRGAWRAVAVELTTPPPPRRILEA